MFSQYNRKRGSVFSQHQTKCFHFALCVCVWQGKLPGDLQQVASEPKRSWAAMSESYGPDRTISRSPIRRRRVPRSPSPPPRGRRRDDGRRTVVERVIKETTASVQYPTLTRTNYNDWVVLMRVNMQA